MNIRRADTLIVSYFRQPGVTYRIGKAASMAVFYFADSGAAAAATKTLDPGRLTPPGDSLGEWPEKPVEVIRSANLIAVLFGVSETQAERLRLAITAGAPQSGR